MAQLAFSFLSIGIAMNGVRYCKMLEDKLEIHMTIRECNMFMQDGAPCHCSKLVSDFLKKNIKTLVGLETTQISIQLRKCGQY